MHLDQDLRHALRRLARRPAFTVTAVATVALGIGATTALWSVVQAVLLRPLPYPEPGRVVAIWNLERAHEETHLSWREVSEYRQTARSFAEVGASTGAWRNLSGGAEPERVPVAFVNASLFALLGVPALHGRTFGPEEDVEGQGQVAVLGYGLWRRRFAGDPAVVGRTIELDGRAHTVVGVMPPRFALPLDAWKERPTDLWLPLALGADSLEAWGNRYLYAFARLRPGVAPAQASRELALIGRQWVAAGHVHDQGDRRFERAAVPAADLLTRRVRPALRLLMGAVGLILLIACVNVTHLLLAAAEERRREVVVRLALGAPRRRLASQLLVESLLLATAGGLVGIALAFAGVRLLTGLGPAIPRLSGAGLDGGSLLFAAAAVLASAVLFGLAPALYGTRPDVAEALAEGGRTASPGRGGRRFRRCLVALETALSAALLVGAGLLLRSFDQLRRVDLGLRPQRVLTAQTSLPAADYPDSAAVASFYERWTAEVAALPGVEAAAAVRLLPLAGEIGDWSITLESRPHDPRENPNGDWQVVTPGYFEAMGLRLLEGRTFTPADRVGAPSVAVVNRTMAERYWPGGRALGSRFRLGTGPGPWFTIVGVSADVRHDRVAEAPRAEMYLPLAQFQEATGGPRRTMTLVARTRGAPTGLAPALRRALRDLDPRLPLSEVRAMEDVVGSALSQPRFTALLLALLAALAAALAAVGLYGVLAYGVARRAHELGIRVTLGATRRDIQQLVVREGMLLAAAGSAVGLALAGFAARFLAGQLYGVAPLDGPTFTAVPVLLAAVALVATLLPARRAARTDPLAALRQRGR